MKKLLVPFHTVLLTLVFLLLFPFSSFAVTLSWNPSTDNIGVTGYKIYMGVATGIYDSNIDVGDVTSYDLGDPTDVLTHYYVVTAYDAAGNESDYSNEVSYLYIDTTVPDAPTVLKVIIITQ